jgi:hypothetical protein
MWEELFYPALKLAKKILILKLMWFLTKTDIFGQGNRIEISKIEHFMRT